MCAQGGGHGLFVLDAWCMAWKLPVLTWPVPCVFITTMKAWILCLGTKWNVCLEVDWFWWVHMLIAPWILHAITNLNEAGGSLPCTQHETTWTCTVNVLALRRYSFFWVLFRVQTELVPHKSPKVFLLDTSGEVWQCTSSGRESKTMFSDASLERSEEEERD